MIKGTINKQRLTLASDKVVADSINYLEAEFSFSDDWNGAAKVAHFSRSDGNTRTEYDILLTDDRIRQEDRLNLPVGNWDVYLHGNKAGQRITTDVVRLRVYRTGVLDGEPLPEIPLPVAEQILAKAANAEDIAQSVRDDTDKMLADAAGTIEAANEATAAAKEATRTASKAAGQVAASAQAVVDAKDRALAEIDGLTDASIGAIGSRTLEAVGEVDREKTQAIQDIRTEVDTTIQGVLDAALNAVEDSERSAEHALASETAAGTHASHALASETAAGTHASHALASETAAAASAGAALESEQHAAGSAQAAVDAEEEIKRIEESIPADYTTMAKDVSELKEDIVNIKSGLEKDAVYHLGFYLDENGDLCQKED